MTQITINAGDTLSAIARKHLGDSSKWREIAEVAGINPLENLQIGATINLPDADSILDRAEPVLSDISAGLNRASSVLDTASKVPFISGYAKEAIAQVDKINQVAGKATQILSDVRGKARSYSGDIKLIDWLLN